MSSNDTDYLGVAAIIFSVIGPLIAALVAWQLSRTDRKRDLGFRLLDRVDGHARRFCMAFRDAWITTDHLSNRSQSLENEHVLRLVERDEYAQAEFRQTIANLEGDCLVLEMFFNGKAVKLIERIHELIRAGDVLRREKNNGQHPSQSKSYRNSGTTVEMQRLEKEIQAIWKSQLMEAT